MGSKVPCYVCGSGLPIALLLPLLTRGLTRVCAGSSFVASFCAAVVVYLGRDVRGRSLGRCKSRSRSRRRDRGDRRGSYYDRAVGSMTITGRAAIMGGGEPRSRSAAACTRRDRSSSAGRIRHPHRVTSAPTERGGEQVGRLCVV